MKGKPPLGIPPSPPAIADFSHFLSQKRLTRVAHSCATPHDHALIKICRARSAPGLYALVGMKLWQMMLGTFAAGAVTT
jgi:hypothetical protein